LLRLVELCRQTKSLHQFGNAGEDRKIDYAKPKNENGTYFNEMEKRNG